MDSTVNQVDMDRTSIQVSEELADELYERKGRGTSYEEFIWSLLDRVDESGETETQEPAPTPTPEPTDADVDFPATVDPDEARRAVLAAREFLAEEGGASMRAIVANVMPEHSLGYDVPELEPGDRYRGAWWRKVIKPGLEDLNEVEKPKPGQSEWRYVGDK